MSIDHSLSPTTTSATTIVGDGTAFTDLPHDIIHSHILTRLNSVTLASVGCVSTQLHSLCINADLWRKNCEETWPSINDPRIHTAVIALPFGYRSLFSDSFSSFHHCQNKNDTDRDRGRDHGCDLSSISNELISAVDMRYKGRSVYSKVQVTNMLTDGVLCGPTWVNMMNSKENVNLNRTEFGFVEDHLLSHAAQNVTLSWILIDPTRKLAANLSSLQPVLIEPHFLQGHVRIRYSTVLTMGDSSSETVEIRIAVRCGIHEGGEVQVKEMNMMMLDKYGKNMKWKDSLVTLQKSGRRENVKGREKYEEYLKRIGERRREEEMAQSKGFKIEGLICMLVFSVVLISWALWYFFRTYILRRRER